MARPWVTVAGLPVEVVQRPVGPPIVDGYAAGSFCANCALRPVSRKCEGCPALAYARREFERWADALDLEVKKPRRRLRKGPQ